MPPKSGKGSGHATAYKSLQEALKWVDLVIEVLDARAPVSSRHPNAQDIFGQKPRLVVLSKEDLADQAKVREWLNLMETSANNDKETPPPEPSSRSQAPTQTISLSLKTQKNRSKLLDISLQLTEEKRLQLKRKGLLPRPMRAVVVGMPNVGKSSLINWMIGKNKAKAANRPGVTKGPQWVRVHPQIELLDTPGFLPSATLNEDAFLKLALLNLIPETSYNAEEISRHGLNLLKKTYPKIIEEYMPDCDLSSASLEDIATLRHFLTHGGKLDTSRAANTFLTDLRNGRLGRITLDRAPQTL
ncbi:MAG: YlqF/YawG family GTPase [Candidatus Obscuribacterales bacterium]|nr:ribosome biogenesis GTPase YlqF [Cyanobacteria bacterium SZAS LIN-5]